MRNARVLTTLFQTIAQEPSGWAKPSQPPVAARRVGSPRRDAEAGVPERAHVRLRRTSTCRLAGSDPSMTDGHRAQHRAAPESLGLTDLHAHAAIGHDDRADDET